DLVGLRVGDRDVHERQLEEALFLDGGTKLESGAWGSRHPRSPKKGWRTPRYCCEAPGSNGARGSASGVRSGLTSRDRADAFTSPSIASRLRLWRMSRSP